MSAFLVTQNSNIQCPHGGQITIVPTNNRVIAEGQKVLSLADVGSVSGCTFFLSSTYSPCVSMSWLNAATRIRVEGQPAVLESSTGTCKNFGHGSQGPPTVIQTQTRVKGV